MGIHENSKASILRDYIKENPTATRKQMAEALGFTLILLETQYVKIAKD